MPAPARAATNGARAVNPKSDMQVTVVAGGVFAPGSNATYTLTIDNNGPQSTPGSNTVTNTLPNGLTFVSAATTGSWICSNSLQVVTCNRVAVYPKNTPTTITITALVTSAAAANVTNVATVADNGDDSNLGNNTASTTSAVYKVSTTPDAAPVSQLPSNTTHTYSQAFVVTNTGGASDSYVVAATVAPAGIVSIVSMTVSGSGTNTTASLAPNGGTATVTVVYSVANAAATGAQATITVTATSTTVSTLADPGSVIVTVARAGLSMVKQLYRDDQTTLVAGGVSTGEYVQYRVTVTSTGGADAATVVVADNIPTQVTYVAATGDLAGWTFTPVTPSPTLTATLTGALTAGSSRYFWIRVRVK